MCASPLKLLRAGPPPPKVALLPDALFFTRAVPIAAGATAAEATQQVELALEAVSPFPLAQLYYGWFWQPGAEHAFVFAAYRRRFTSDQTSEWAGAELVLPASVALFGAEVQPATTVVLHAPEGMTAIHWETAGVPTRVLFRPLDPEASDEERDRLRNELVSAMGGSKTVVDVAALPAPEPVATDREIVFRAGDFVSRLPAPVAASLDVRDKGELLALRNARKRDVVLWRTALAAAASLLLLLFLEFSLVGGGMWQKVRIAQLNGRKPVVDKIKASDDMANRIDALVNNRLLPLEMVTVLVGTDTARKPADITFTKVETRPASGLYTLFIDAQTTNTALIPAYVSQIRALPEVLEAKEFLLTGQGDRFQMTITFKPDQLKPTTSG